MIRCILLFSCMALTSCVATPLSRSYDDPYNAPLPNEPAPPTLNAAQSNCIRDSLSCDVACVKDKDCKEDEACHRGTCIIDEVPQLGEPQQSPQ